MFVEFNYIISHIVFILNSENFLIINMSEDVMTKKIYKGVKENCVNLGVTLEKTF